LEDFLDQKLIKDLKNYSTVDHVLFEFTELTPLSEKQKKLQSYLSTSNMVLFAENGKIKKYETVNQIIDEFCSKRLEFYFDRKKVLLSSLQKKQEKQKLTLRFLEDVMDNKLIVFKRKEADIIADMISLGYKDLGYKDLGYKDLGYKDDIEHSDQDLPGQFGQDDLPGQFGHLLRMPVRNFSKEKIKSLTQTISDLDKEIASLQKIHPTSMWSDDIKNFKAQYSIWLEFMDKEMKRLDKLRTAKIK